MTFASLVDRGRKPFLVAVPILLIAGCVSEAPTAPRTLADAEHAIEDAEKLDAGHFATAELDEARQKLASADRAVLANDLVLAERLGLEARATAELAAARTEATKAEATNAEMARGTQALIEEMQRASGR